MVHLEAVAAAEEPGVVVSALVAVEVVAGDKVEPISRETGVYIYLSKTLYETAIRNTIINLLELVVCRLLAQI